MQTLGLSDSMPRTEGRLKSLFWPSIRSGSDVDYLGAQGYWVCTIVGVFSLVFLVVSGHPTIGLFTLFFYFLSGVGVRERSRYAAGCVFAIYVADMLLSGPSIVRIVLAGLLLSNLRATWIAAGWKADSEEAALPPRWGDTWSDKFADRLPLWLWPKVKVLYYVLSVCFLVLSLIGIAAIITRRA